MSRERQEQRVLKLLNAIKDGRTPEELQAILSGIEMGREAQMRGSQSELLVKRVLSRLSMVDHVVRSNPRSREDLSGRDLSVYIKPERQVDFVDRVDVQVKSSRKGVDAFKAYLIARHHIPPRALSELLCREKLVVISAGGSQDSIARSFIDQLYAISRYHLGGLGSSGEIRSALAQ